MARRLGYLGGVVAAPARDLVLVGGGHAHVQVIRRWMMERPPGARLTVVLDRPEAVYSGMVPGFAAGDYLIACNEYCGVGHHTMAAKLHVVPRSAWSAPTSTRTTAARITAGGNHGGH